jgi:ribonuclease G
MGQRVLINVEPEDIRVAVLEEGVLTDLFIENRHEKTIVGDIYKGVVTDVIPGIQAAFVDIGLERNAFLHVQDIPPTGNDEPFKERRRRTRDNGSGDGKRMNISDYLKPGQKIMVQAIKDGIGEKGPRISEYVSLPGRYLVLLPNQAEDDAGGVSRKIEDSRERARLKRLLESIDVTEGSVILRTAAVDTGDEAIRADVDFLRRTWGRIQAKFHTAKAPSLLHTDYDILYRLVRDVFTEEIDEICIDDTAEHANLVRMLRQYLPKLKNRVLLYPSTRNIFEVYDIERQIYKALRKRVWLRSGGHVIIDECEALTAIDVNTGKFIGKEDQDATVLRTNLESARVIARQLRLRDIGGIIIIDFIDMRRREHREEVLRELKRCLRLDRSRTTVSEFTSLGIVEMTRKRVRHSLRKTLQRDCPHCGGGGMILSLDSTWRVVRNAILSLIEDHPDHDIRAQIHPELLSHIEERHTAAVREIEDEHGIDITFVAGDPTHQERYSLEAFPHAAEEEGAPAEATIVVTGKRFSGAELDEPPAARPQRRRGRPARRPEVVETYEEGEVEETREGMEEELASAADAAETQFEEVTSAESEEVASADSLREAEAEAPEAEEAEEERAAPPRRALPEERRGAAVSDETLRILEGESLSGRLASHPPAVGTGERREEETEIREGREERRGRRRTRGGRGRHRGRHERHEEVRAGNRSSSESFAPDPDLLEEVMPAASGGKDDPPVSTAKPKSGPSAFTPVEEYLGDGGEGAPEPAPAAAEEEVAVEKPSGRRAASRRRPATRRRRPRRAKPEGSKSEAPGSSQEAPEE